MNTSLTQCSINAKIKDTETKSHQLGGDMAGSWPDSATLCCNIYHIRRVPDQTVLVLMLWAATDVNGNTYAACSYTFYKNASWLHLSNDCSVSLDCPCLQVSDISTHCLRHATHALLFKQCAQHA